VKTDRSDTEIAATIRARTQERVDGTTIQAERGENGMLLVTANWPAPGRYDNESCSFDIEVPEANGAVLKSSNGSLTIKGLSGSAQLHTSNGSIHATGQEGPVDAHTSNGSIHVDRAEGDVKSHTSNGSIFVDRTKGAVDAKSSNGRVEVTEAAAAVKANTSNGSVSIQLAEENPGPIEARTSNGRIELDLSPVFSGELTLETSHSAIRANDLPGARLISAEESRLCLGFGDGQAKSAAKTSNGKIAVRMRSAADALPEATEK